METNGQGGAKADDNGDGWADRVGVVRRDVDMEVLPGNGLMRSGATGEAGEELRPMATAGATAIAFPLLPAPAATTNVVHAPPPMLLLLLLTPPPPPPKRADGDVPRTHGETLRPRPVPELMLGSSARKRATICATDGGVSSSESLPRGEDALAVEENELSRSFPRSAYSSLSLLCPSSL